MVFVLGETYQGGRMKLRGIHTCILIIPCLAIGVVWYACTGIFFAVHSYTFVPDNLLSSATNNEIQKEVQSTRLNSLASIAHDIQAKWPMIQTICVTRWANKTVHIYYKSQPGYAVINEDHVLLSNGQLAGINTFTVQAIQNLPRIRMDGQASAMSGAFKQWLLQLDAPVLHAYAIQWTDDYAIYLHDKCAPTNKLICSVTTTVDKRIREKCQQIIQEKKGGAHGTASGLFYTADIRFEKQIIFCSQKGGALHG